VNRLRRGLLLGATLIVASLVVPLTVLVRDKWEPLQRFDVSAEEALDLPPGPARDVALGLTQLGAPLLLEAVALVLVVLFLVRRRRRLAAYVAVTVFGASLLSTTVKHLVSRVRPCVEGGGLCPHSTSFPSGHALASAAFWTMAAVLLLPVLGRRAWWLLAIPPVVALTRVLLGVHYPSDVVAGLLMGGCWAAAWTAVFAAWREDRAGRELPLEEGVG
jgi:undecaprenyl-diphosphatase